MISTRSLQDIDRAFTAFKFGSPEHIKDYSSSSKLISGSMRRSNYLSRKSIWNYWTVVVEHVVSPAGIDPIGSSRIAEGSGAKVKETAAVLSPLSASTCIL